MRLDRILIAVPLLGGALLTGTALAHVAGVSPTVRDVIYPTAGAGIATGTDTQRCQHNGVHYNKQGHANCGLHKGWSGDTATTSDSTPASDTTNANGQKSGQASATHGKSGTHGNSGTHGKSGTHGDSGTHSSSGTHGKSGTHGSSGTHGKSGHHGHAKHDR